MIGTTNTNTKIDLSPYALSSSVPIIKRGYVQFGQSGSTNIGSTTYYGGVTVYYGYTFPSAPTVILTANDLSSGVFGAEIDGAVTNTYFQCTGYGASTGTYGVYWVAIWTG